MVETVRNSSLEQELLANVSRDRLWEYVSTIAQEERMSGSSEEKRAMQYIAETLSSWDVDVDEYEHDGYVSEPGRARLDVLAPESQSLECITHSFAGTGSARGEVVYVGQGTDASYDGIDVKCKIVLVEGLAGPGKVVAAESRGAAAAIFINDHNLHQMIVTPVWGTPTPDTSSKIPDLIVVSVRLEDGNRLKEWISTGRVEVDIETEVRREWAKLPIVVGTITGAIDPDHFVMLAGHIDSWFFGAIDNAAANATTLEVMRVLAERRADLRRGFRVVIWSGHSHGRYAGSTWYADEFWEELYDRCVSYVNVDSTGAVQATLYEEILAMPETSQLATDVIADLTGQTSEVNRVGRAGDQSFWGIGIPSVYMSLSRVPVETAPELSRAMGTLTGRKKSGQAWFWHTEHDTLDKVDLDVLELDTKIYLSTILRIINSEVLPFDYTATVAELIRALGAYREQSKDRLPLDSLIGRAELLRDAIATLNERVESLQTNEQKDIVNETLVQLGRLLVPLNYTEAGQFEHDLALHAPALPALHEANKLGRLDPESDEYRFLKTRLARRSNQVAMALRWAKECVDDTLSQLSK